MIVPVHRDRKSCMSAHLFVRLLLPIGLAFGTASLSYAESGVEIPTRADAARVNDNTIGVVFTHEELFHQLVHNLEAELEQESNLRIVPIMGKNHVQSVFDLLYLKGIDLALLRADALEYVRRNADMDSVLRVTRNIAKISDEKLIVVASTDYDSIEDLDGQVVGFGIHGSGEFVTGSLAFDIMGIESIPIEVDEVTAIERVKSGELAAIVYLLRAPDAIQTGTDLEASKAMAALKADEEVHVLPLPESEAMSAIYRPTTLTNDDLPLIPAGESIASYSVDVILAAYNFRDANIRSQKQERFVNAFVDGLDGLQSDVYQPVWKRVELGLQTPNVASSSLVTAIVAEREARQVELEEATRVAKAQAEAEIKAQKIEELTQKREELTSRLGKELSDADTAELEKMLEKLDSFLDSTTSE